MAEATIKIIVPATSKEEFKPLVMALVIGEEGDPLAGVSVHFRIEGDGTFDASRQAETKEYEAVSGERGQVVVPWVEYPSHWPRRELISTVRISCNAPDCRLRLKRL